MKNYIKHHPWSIIEEAFDKKVHRVSESIFSIGNGRMGQRANFEEDYSGESLQGAYLAGIYYPDKTRVGWWKNGYPEYFAKVLNSVNWIGLHITVNHEILDLNNCEILDFKRELDMKAGILHRSFTAKMKNGITVEASASRFCSAVNKNLGVLKYELKVNQKAQVNVEAYIDGAVHNQDANYDEYFWENCNSGIENDNVFIHQKTKKTAFEIVAAAKTIFEVNNEKIQASSSFTATKAIQKIDLELDAFTTLAITKYAVVVSDLYFKKENLKQEALQNLNEESKFSYETHAKAQADVWDKKWEECDIEIEGDVSAQQAIRFNIFQLYQTYAGDDARLNIGPKGFTGEKYGGSTYWDTEAYCIPFYLSTANQNVARNLLEYRYHHLEKAIENASKLGFVNGAALYPMVTMNGEECHNEWEITFEEIHRNGAIVYAIYDYIKYTGDQAYMAQFGFEVIAAIARFWTQRLNFSNDKNKFVMLGVTGPNEFENNVNNNWYTNKMAEWCLQYGFEQYHWLLHNEAESLARIVNKIGLGQEEVNQWNFIASNIYFPFDTKHQVFLQQDGFLDKELIPASKIPTQQRPIVEHWSWDRILRSCYIKQADVLQGFYFFEEQFDMDTHKRHYDFYEPLTVHESSLSPCVHSILAAKLGDESRAYEFYLRTARLDLDDINNDTRDGCHTTSMAGTWMTITKGFAGMRVLNNQLNFNPFLPLKWNKFSFKIKFRENLLAIEIENELCHITNINGPEINIAVKGNSYNISAHAQIIINYKSQTV